MTIVRLILAWKLNYIYIAVRRNFDILDMRLAKTQFAKSSAHSGPYLLSHE